LETAGLPLNLRPWVLPPKIPEDIFILLDFPVHLVLAAMAAELLHLDTFCRGFLVLGRRIVAVLALRALECDDVARHCVIYSSLTKKKWSR
jgi:hypothetical protein